jgi:hypothetical protein
MSSSSAATGGSATRAGAGGPAAVHKCSGCGVEFPSRTALFKHLRSLQPGVRVRRVCSAVAAMAAADAADAAATAAATAAREAAASSPSTEVEAFAASGRQAKSFPPTLTAEERKAVHDRARSLGLVSKSRGTASGDGRVITISKPTAKQLAKMKAKGRKVAASPDPPRSKVSTAAFERAMLDFHERILCHLGVVSLWRARGVSRDFRQWAATMLSSFPRVVAVGGQKLDWSTVGGVFPPKLTPTRTVATLDPTSLRWSANEGCIPGLPDPRREHATSCSAEGRVVVCGGCALGCFDPLIELTTTALQWLPRTSEWSRLPDMPEGLMCASSVCLPDGRTMVIGGISGLTEVYDAPEPRAVASVYVLAADGSSWSKDRSLTTRRIGPAAVALPDGKVLVAGGTAGRGADTSLKSAELWDPRTRTWTSLPPMAHERSICPACVLPSGLVAVVGGYGTDGKPRKDGEVFNPATRGWEPLVGAMKFGHAAIGASAVPGGLVVMGASATIDPDREQPAELYDEESARWFRLPGALIEEGLRAPLVSVPAAAFADSTHIS